MRHWRLLPFVCLRASENMAEDEAIFLLSRDRRAPSVRFYTWISPAVSVGYFQQVGREIDLAACRRHGVDIVRRPTGGKAVLHGQDLTYAVAGIAHRDGFTADILGNYRRISRCLIRGLHKMGIRVQAADEGRHPREMPAQSSCFSVPSRYELLVRKRKICGSAQVRAHGAFLQHGSLLMAFDPLRTAELLSPGSDGCDGQVDRLRRSVTSLCDEGITLPDVETICGIMKEGFETELGVHLEEAGLTPDEEALKERLLKDKYTSDQWNLEGRTDRWTWQNS